MAVQNFNVTTLGDLMGNRMPVLKTCLMDYHGQDVIAVVVVMSQVVWYCVPFAHDGDNEVTQCAQQQVMDGFLSTVVTGG